ncbi:hypothetical protein QJQ45_020293 [Haematococcus lacustris]|nr:hypothetical protein QJQ45_020293 [Haematococcus lacustris]
MSGCMWSFAVRWRIHQEQRVATFQWVNKDGQLRTLYPDPQMVRDVSTDAFPAPAYVNDIADPDVAAAGGQPGSGAGADKTFNWPYHTLVYLKPLFDAEREVGWSAARIMRHSHQQAHVWRSYVFQAAEHWAQMTTAGTAPVAFAASGEPLGQGVPASITVPDDASHMGNMHLMQTFNTFVPELNLKQQEAVKMAAFAPLMLLTGAAGCGKTYATKAIVHLWRQQGKTVMLCAPTGRAAQRLQEMVGGQGGTACEAKTVHRLLGYQPRQGKAQDPQGGGAGGEVPGTQQQQQQQQPQSGGAGSTVTGGPGAKAGGEGVVAAVPLSASKVAGGLELLDQGVFKFNANNKLPAHAGEGLGVGGLEAGEGEGH